MKKHVFAAAAILALALAAVASSPAGAAVDREHQITIPGTVVAADGGKLVIRTDDHGHHMPFELAPATSQSDGVRKGAHVSVTYHALGSTGQAADVVQVIERNADARSQASFKLVTGPADTRISAR